MQETYEHEGTEFNIGKDPHETYERLKKKFNAQLDQYGLWNGLEEQVSDIGMTMLEHSWVTKEEEDILSEILAADSQF